MRAEDLERQPLSERFIAGLEDYRARRISDEPGRHAAAPEHPESGRLVEELTGIEEHLAGLHPEGERHPAGARNRPGDPPGASGAPGGHMEAGRVQRDMFEPDPWPLHVD